VVKGVVTRVHTMESSNTTFVDFGPAYPNQTFTAVIFASAKSRFPNVEKLVGNTVLVKGRVKLYKGKPEIVLEYAEQLLVVS
jgi:DNA/RNA endonuclease YhcR with UshA esterase domain